MKKIFLFLAVLFLSGCSEPTQIITPTAPIEPTVAVHKTEEKKFKSVAATDFKNLLDNRSHESIILDVRTVQELEQGYIKGAWQRDFYTPSFQKNISALDKNIPYYIYCHSGVRSAKTLELMKSLGFTNVTNLKHGIVEWEYKKFPTLQPVQ